MERALAAGPPDPHGLTVLPFLAGERAPGWRGDRRATIAGLGLETTARAHPAGRPGGGGAPARAGLRVAAAACRPRRTPDRRFGRGPGRVAAWAQTHRRCPRPSPDAGRRSRDDEPGRGPAGAGGPGSTGRSGRRTRPAGSDASARSRPPCPPAPGARAPAPSGRRAPSANAGGERGPGYHHGHGAQRPEVVVLPDAAALADRAAQSIVDAATDAVAARGRFMLALAGGDTPRRTYARLAASPRQRGDALGADLRVLRGRALRAARPRRTPTTGWPPRRCSSKVPIPPGPRRSRMRGDAEDSEAGARRRMGATLARELRARAGARRRASISSCWAWASTATPPRSFPALPCSRRSSAPSPPSTWRPPPSPSASR